MQVDELLAQAKSLHQAGRTKEAEPLYRKVLAAQPDHADATHFLGTLLDHTDRREEAIGLLERSVRMNPAAPHYFNNFAEALRKAGRHAEAIESYRRAIGLRPDYGAAFYNMGLALHALSRMDEAADAFRRSAQLMPHHAPSHNNLGVHLRTQQRWDVALAAFERAHALAPDHREAHLNLAETLMDVGRGDEALSHFAALASRWPQVAQVHYKRAGALIVVKRLDEAEEAYGRALALDPAHAAAMNDLGNLHRDCGRIDDAIECFRRSLAVESHPVTHSNLVYALYFSPRYDAESILAEHRQWDQNYARPLADAHPAYPIDRDKQRRLRIGYVSPDFRQHPVGAHLLAVLAAHDETAFQVHCYCDVSAPDAVTERAKAHADVWRQTARLSNEQFAGAVREDKVDILIDCTLHMGGNRLLAFARKPAPVQVTYFGYPGTTGLSAIDYRISDVHLDPPGNDGMYSEQTLRLADSFWCYSALAGAPDPGPLPADHNGVVTFGCLNNFGKVTPDQLRLWARVMRSVRGSRLLLLCDPGRHRRHVLDLLQEQAIAPDRVEFVEKCPPLQYLHLYRRLDVSLDTLPYNGHTTSLDSIYMGAAVVTLTGITCVGRAGLSILQNIGLGELVAESEEGFVDIAVELANDRKRLIQLRHDLRDRLQASALMDPKRLTPQVESAYRAIWEQWCDRE